VIAIVIERAGEPTRRKVFVRGREVTIGRGVEHDLVLPHAGVAAHHATLSLEADVITITPVDRAVVAVEGVRVNGLAPVYGTITIGVYSLQIADAPKPPVRVPAGIERELLDAIARGDEPMRLVYADWLEAEGDLTRAEFLRVQHRLAALPAEDPGFELATDQLRELAAQVDVLWRARVARLPIEGCADVKFDFLCPREWSALQPTEREKVRFCGSCKQQVFYSASIAEARRHAKRGECVALDLGVARWGGDLDAPFDIHRCRSCKLDVGPQAMTCPKCGGTVRYPMLRGGMLASEPPE
jgi:uncharacterized protein (TIGR02996 family)